jgi:hypothetical protein
MNPTLANLLGYVATNVELWSGSVRRELAGEDVKSLLIASGWMPEGKTLREFAIAVAADVQEAVSDYAELRDLERDELKDQIAALRERIRQLETEPEIAPAEVWMQKVIAAGNKLAEAASSAIKFSDHAAYNREVREAITAWGSARDGE